MNIFSYKRVNLASEGMGPYLCFRRPSKPPFFYFYFWRKREETYLEYLYMEISSIQCKILVMEVVEASYDVLMSKPVAFPDSVLISCDLARLRTNCQKRSKDSLDVKLLHIRSY